MASSRASARLRLRPVPAQIARPSSDWRGRSDSPQNSQMHSENHSGYRESRRYRGKVTDKRRIIDPIIVSPSRQEFPANDYHAFQTKTEKIPLDDLLINKSIPWVLSSRSTRSSFSRSNGRQSTANNPLPRMVRVVNSDILARQFDGLTVRLKRRRSRS